MPTNDHPWSSEPWPDTGNVTLYRSGGAGEVINDGKQVEDYQRARMCVNERPLVEAVADAARKVCEYGAKQLHMKNLRRAILALQKHRTAVQSLKEMRSKS